MKNQLNDAARDVPLKYHLNPTRRCCGLISIGIPIECVKDRPQKPVIRRFVLSAGRSHIFDRYQNPTVLFVLWIALRRTSIP